jgi:hypothetical protein
MTDDREYIFKVAGTIHARDDEEALARLTRTLTVLGFTDVGDGTLSLDRPKDVMDDYGMAMPIGEYPVSITNVAVEERVTQADQPIDADYR